MEKLKRYFPLADQIVVSGGNFVITVILARLLTENAFGSYSIIWLIVISIAAAFQALFFAPLLSLFPKLNSVVGLRLIRLIFNQLLLVLLTFSFLLAIISVFFKFSGYVELSNSALYLLALALPYYLFEFFRRVFMIRGCNSMLFGFDLFNYTAISGGLLFFCDGAFPKSIWIISGSFLVTATLMNIFVLQIKYIRRTHYSRYKYLISMQWEYSKWLLGSSFMQFISGNALTLFSGAIVSLNEVGFIRMAQNLVGVINPIYLFIDNHAQIYLARIKHEIGQTQCEKAFLKICTFCMLGLTVILGTVFVFNDELISLVYGSDSEMPAIYLNVMLALSLISGANFLQRLIVKVDEDTKYIFKSYVVSSIIAFVAVYPLCLELGGVGAIYAMILSQFAMLVVIFISRKNKGRISD